MPLALATETPLANVSVRPDWSRRIPALDGLRGIAILLVLLCHCMFCRFRFRSSLLSQLLAAGSLTWTGVDLFFVLSGFLIGGILLDARESPNYFKTFYIRRFYRIFPLYFAVLGCFLINCYLPLPARLRLAASASPIPWWSYATLTQNLWMVKIGSYGAPFMGITWSLAVEEQFYLTIPFLIRRIPSKWLAVLMYAIIIGAPILRLALSHTFEYGNFYCYVLMPCRADALGLGVLSACLVRREGFWDLLIKSRAAVQALAVLFFVGVIFMTCRHWQQMSDQMVRIGYSWFAVFYALCLLLVVSHQGKTILCNSALMTIGTLAYCSYLVHPSLIIIAQRLSWHFFPTHPNVTRAMVILCIPATLGIAGLSWKYLENPMLRRGHTYTYQYHA